MLVLCIAKQIMFSYSSILNIAMKEGLLWYIFSRSYARTVFILVLRLAMKLICYITVFYDDVFRSRVMSFGLYLALEMRNIAACRVIKRMSLSLLCLDVF